MRTTALLLLLLAGCSGQPARQIVRTSLEPTTHRGEGPPPLRQLKQLILEEADPTLTHMLLTLLQAETDQRSQAYMRAGRDAWLAGREKLADALWRAALDCRPRKPHRMPVGTELVLFTYRPTRLFQPRRGKVRDFLPPDTPADLQAPLLKALLEQLGRPAARRRIVRHGWVLALATAAQADGELAALKQLAASQADQLIEVEARFVEAEIGPAPDALRGLLQMREPISLSAATRDQLARWMKRREGVRLVAAPRLICFPYQAASISITSQVAYVKDYGLSQAQGRLVAEPVIGTISDGVRVAFRAVRLGDGALLYQVRPEQHLLQRPIPEVLVRPPGGASDPLLLQIPERLSLSATHTIRQPPDGAHWVPIGITRRGDRLRAHGLLIQLRCRQASSKRAAR